MKRKSTDLRSLPMIGPERKFYGHLTGLGVKPYHGHGIEEAPGMRYASFEHEGKISVYLVLDCLLFSALSRHLCIMAYVRDSTGNFGKLQIEQLADGQWAVRN